MDPFEFFFTFYGLILGLAAAEILNSVGAYARTKPLRAMEPQAALLAFLIFLVICATWLDAFAYRAVFELSFASMVCPIGAATAYYLAAVVALPKNKDGYDDMEKYFIQKKGFVIAMLAVAELFVMLITVPVLTEDFTDRPAIFWLQRVPMTFLVFGGWTLLFFAQRRRSIIVGLLLQILIFTIPYWSQGWIGRTIRAAYGYS
jgi:hypothetical protein